VTLESSPALLTYPLVGEVSLIYPPFILLHLMSFRFLRFPPPGLRSSWNAPLCPSCIGETFSLALLLPSKFFEGHPTHRFSDDPLNPGRHHCRRSLIPFPFSDLFFVTRRTPTIFPGNISEGAVSIHGFSASFFFDGSFALD